MRIYNDSKLSPIFLAIKQGNTEKVQQLVETDKSLLQEKEQEGGLPIHMACEFQRNDIVQYLLEKNANVHDENGEAGQKPLMVAYSTNPANLELLKVLLEAGSSPLCLDGAGYSCLALAGENGDLAAIKLFFETNPKLREQDEDTLLFTFTMAAVGGHCDVIRYLVEKGVKVEGICVSFLEPALCTAVKSDCPGRIQVVQTLVELNADINATDNKGNNCMGLAAKYKKADLLVELFKMKADPNHRNKEGMSPLHLAAASGHEPCVTALVNGCGVDPAVITEKTQGGQ